MEYNNTLYEYWATLFETERAVGIKLTREGER